MKTTGNRIKEIREQLNLTGEEFGNKLNVTKTAVSNWENNNRTPDAEMLVKIADLGDVTIDYLLCRTDNPKVKVSKGTIDGDNVEVGINKNYPHNLTPNEVDKLLSQLMKVGFDVNKLIENAKQGADKEEI